MVEFVNASATTQKKTGMSFFRAAFLLKVCFYTVYPNLVIIVP